MLSAGTLVSFKDKMSPLNILVVYNKLTVCMLSVYLIALCTQFYFILLLLLFLITGFLSSLVLLLLSQW
jgi:hypothetical protein